MCPDPNYTPESREVYNHANREFERWDHRLGIAETACFVLAVLVLATLIFVLVVQPF